MEDRLKKPSADRPVTDMTDRFVDGYTRAHTRAHEGITNQSVTSVTRPPSSPQSSLLRLLPRSHYDAEAIKRNGWIDLGVLVVSADDARLTWPECELIRSLGTRLYGRRGGGSRNG